MCGWGLDEKVFHHLPPGSRSGFRNLIDILLTSHQKSQLGCHFFVRGLVLLTIQRIEFLRSMGPALFNNAKGNGNLIIQVWSHVVVPN